jgi:hypothetical protein
MDEEELEVLEQVEISDDEDDDFNYEGVDDLQFADDDEDEEDDDEEDLAAAMASVNMSPDKADSAGNPRNAKVKPVTQVRPSVVDDFIRNFLIKVDMKQTLDVFNTEWYELSSKGKIGEEYTNPVPDIYMRNQELDDQVDYLRQQLAKMREITAKAQGTWDKFRKERDFHRMHHKRVVQEKGKLTTDLKRLRKHYTSFEPTLKELQRKYEVAMKEKMLMRLERDRMRARVATLEVTVKQMQEESGGAPAGDSPKSKPRKKKGRDSKLPPDDTMVNPYAELDFDPPPVERFQLRKTFRGHLNSVSGVAFHPRKPIIATVSDDQTWKLWSVPDCDLIMSGEGHRDWMSGVDFRELEKKKKKKRKRTKIPFPSLSCLFIYAPFFYCTDHHCLSEYFCVLAIFLTPLVCFLLVFALASRPARHAPCDEQRRQDRQGLGLRGGVLRGDLRRPHAARLGRGVPPRGRLCGELQHGPHHAVMGPQQQPLPPDLPRPRRQRQQRLLAALLQQRHHGVRRQDRVALGRAERPLRADFLRPPQRRLQHLRQHARGHSGLLRRRWCGQDLGRAHGRGARHHRGLPAPSEHGDIRPVHAAHHHRLGRLHDPLLQHGGQEPAGRAAWPRGRGAGGAARPHRQPPRVRQLRLHLPLLVIDSKKTR